MRPSRFAFAFCAAVAFVPSAALAQDTAATGAATALFDEATALMAKGKYAEACPKLARSQELAPNGGTLFTLAECYEKNGQWASAWVTYKDASDRAHAAHKPQPEKAALAAAAKLESKVSKLTVDVPKNSEIDGLVVKRDGREVKRAEWNIAVPLDPGAHTFEAVAPGRLPWSAKVSIGNDASQKSIAVPLLEVDPSAAPAPPPVVMQQPPPPDTTHPPAEEPRSSGGTQRAVGLVIGGIGLVGIGVGAFFGLQASSKNDDAATHCRTATQCDAEGVALDKEARDAATISTIAMIAGGVALVGGTVIFLTAPSKKEPAASVGFRAAPGGGTLTFGATF